MLARVLEPEVMDTAADAADYDAMDHAAVNRRFVDDLVALAGATAALAGEALAGETLDLGTGTAQIVIELALRRPSVRIVAVDAAAEMLKLAAKNLAAAGVADRVALQLVDAKRLPYADGRFACVMSNSILHHIPEPRDVLREAVRVTAPWGRLFFRDLLRPHDAATLASLVATYAAGANSHQRQLFADSLHAALSLAEIQSLVEELGFSRATVQATSDRHWTWAAVKPFSTERRAKESEP